MWIAFLLLHLIGSAGYNLLLRKSLVAKVDQWTLATVMQTGIAVPMLFVAFFYPPHFADYDIIIILKIIATAGLVIALHFANVKALQHLEAGVYSILYNLRIIFTTILGIVFLNEQIIPLQILGGLLIFLAVLTIRQKGRKTLTAQGTNWGLTAALTISVLNLFEKDLITELGFLQYSVPVMLLAAAIMWIILLAQGKTIPLEYFRQPRTIQLMVFRAISAYGFTLAFSAGALLSVGNYISSLSVIIIVLLGAWLLGENDYMKQKLIATGLAVLGLTVILISNLIK